MRTRWRCASSRPSPMHRPARSASRGPRAGVGEPELRDGGGESQAAPFTFGQASALGEPCPDGVIGARPALIFRRAASSAASAMVPRTRRSERSSAGKRFTAYPGTGRDYRGGRRHSGCRRNLRLGQLGVTALAAHNGTNADTDRTLPGGGKTSGRYHLGSWICDLRLSHISICRPIGRSALSWAPRGSAFIAPPYARRRAIRRSALGRCRQAEYHFPQRRPEIGRQAGRTMQPLSAVSVASCPAGRRSRRPVSPTSPASSWSAMARQEAALSRRLPQASRCACQRLPSSSCIPKANSVPIVRDRKRGRAAAAL